MAPTRWGIAGAGKISSDFTSAVQMLPTDHHLVAAVGARTLSGAQDFAQKFNIPKTYGSYQELAEDSSLDVIYVGTIHPTHYDVCKILLNAGRNVLCEKPLTMNGRHARELVSLAKEKKVFFMEGYWSRFFPVYQRLREELFEGTIGQVEIVQVSFGANMRHIPRLTEPELGGGVMLDLGGYPVQLALLIFGESPEKIVASGNLTSKGVEESSFATLYFSNNRVAQLNVSSGVPLNQKAFIFGSKGQMEIPNFWNPEELVTPEKTYLHPVPKATVEMNFRRSQGFVYEAEAVRQSLIKGETENPLMSHEDTLRIMDIIEEIKRQIGVVSNEDTK